MGELRCARLWQHDLERGGPAMRSPSCTGREVALRLIGEARREDAR